VRTHKRKNEEEKKPFFHFFSNARRFYTLIEYNVNQFDTGEMPLTE